MNSVYINKIKRMNSIIYINLIMILAIIPLLLRIIDNKYFFIIIGIEAILIIIYINIVYRKIKLINSNEKKLGKKDIIGLYASILGVAIMCFSEGYIYKGTGKINFLVIIISVCTLTPMIKFDEKYNKKNYENKNSNL